MEYQDRVLKQREQLNASGRQELHYLVEPKRQRSAYDDGSSMVAGQSGG